MAGAMRSLYSRLRGFVRPYFDAITPLITDKCYDNEVLKLLALLINIRPCIVQLMRHAVCQTELELRHLAIRLHQ